MTVHLPTRRDIVVDAKVPLDAYTTALEAADEDSRDAHLDGHAAQLRAHLDRLATKAYHAKLEHSAEFVVCFAPNEACYVAALDRDPRLEHGAARGVLIATPTTLLALLHATHYGWRRAEVEQSALEIAAAAPELRVAGLPAPASRRGSVRRLTPSAATAAPSAARRPSGWSRR
jgi:DNA recombination protein RmuC